MLVDYSIRDNKGKRSVIIKGISLNFESLQLTKRVPISLSFVLLILRVVQTEVSGRSTATFLEVVTDIQVQCNV